ncbi:MAG: hypothetical protein M3Q73_01685, partial [bacterium]|nr:hypothetical protein [bacterium]
FAFISSLSTTKPAAEAKRIINEGIAIGTRGQVDTEESGWKITKKPLTAYPAFDKETGEPFWVAEAVIKVPVKSWSPPLNLRKMYTPYAGKLAQQCLPPGHEYQFHIDVAEEDKTVHRGKRRLNGNSDWVIPVPLPPREEIPSVIKGIKPETYEFYSIFREATFVVKIIVAKKEPLPTTLPEK